MMLWEILKDLNSKDYSGYYPVGLRFQSVAPCWNLPGESKAIIEVKAINSHPEAEYGKTLKWVSMPTDSKHEGQLVSLSGAAIKYDWVMVDGTGAKGEEIKG